MVDVTRRSVLIDGQPVKVEDLDVKELLAEILNVLLELRAIEEMREQINGS